MFTGIVEELGTVVAVEELGTAARLTIGAATVLHDVERGASMAVDGVCLTVTGWFGDGEGGKLTADVMKETLDRSTLGGLRPGDRVNLERPVRPADRLGGHLVQGHVDGVGTILDRVRDERWEVVRISLPAGLTRYVVEKGSIAVDGISLTVAAVDEATFTVALIPTTLELTTLGRKGAGDRVNLEVDVMAKHVEKLLASTGRLA